MNCDEARENLDLYILDDLNAKEMNDLKGHLSKCDGCQTAYTEHKDFIQRLDKDVTGLFKQKSKKRVLEVLRSGPGPVVKRYPILRIRYIAAAAAVILTLALFWILNSQRPFEHYFQDNRGYVKALAGSIVRKINDQEFRLENGSVVLYTKSRIIIHTSTAKIDIEPEKETAADIDVSVKEGIQTIKVRSGVLDITGSHVPFGKVSATGGDVVCLSEERKKRIENALTRIINKESKDQIQTMRELIEFEADAEANMLMKTEGWQVRNYLTIIVKTVRLIRESESLKSLHREFPDLIEGLAQKPRLEWPAIIGRSYDSRLSPKDKKVLAQVLLSEQDILERFEKVLILSSLSADQIWFFLEALDYPDTKIRSHSAKILSYVAKEKLSIELATRCIKALIFRLDDEDFKVRTTASSAISTISNSIRAQQELLEILVNTLIDKLKTASANSLIYSTLGRIVTGKASDPINEIVMNSVRGILDHENIDVRVKTFHALGKIGAYIDGKYLPEIMKVLTSKLGDTEAKVRAAATEAIGTVTLFRSIEQSGISPADLLSTLKSLLKEEKDENVRQQIQRAIRCIERIR